MVVGRTERESKRRRERSESVELEKKEKEKEEEERNEDPGRGPTRWERLVCPSSSGSRGLTLQ